MVIKITSYFVALNELCGIVVCVIILTEEFHTGGDTSDINSEQQYWKLPSITGHETLI